MNVGEMIHFKSEKLIYVHENTREGELQTWCVYIQIEREKEKKKRMPIKFDMKSDTE